ncbi:hypothetical protein HMPREF9004_0182 [Schaalia cardiffensis F0333]|uniref:Uncharacterized protein n=1 Tax=Schaalia cardiffensis F0333 TaxID=888050 RepID=N6WFR9_9ACTO|nr:hypothetical protein [Schaalia cardiffensis]ENO19079.1 hypothetical protein HMPREF9004_0182 [Schaalia cardiffensis F0333]
MESTSITELFDGLFPFSEHQREVFDESFDLTELPEQVLPALMTLLHDAAPRVRLFLKLDKVTQQAFSSGAAKFRIDRATGGVMVTFYPEGYQNIWKQVH